MPETRTKGKPKAVPSQSRKTAPGSQKRTSTPRPAPRPALKSGVSYRVAAERVGVSAPHLFNVLAGNRESRRLIAALEAEQLLQPLAKGIGKN